VDAETPPAIDAGEGAVTPRARIPFSTRLAVLELATTSPHLSHSEIGRLLGLSHQSVMRLRQAATTDVKSLTQTVMQSDIAPALEEWTAARTQAALRGDHRPSRDWLVAAGAIEDTSKAASVAVGFQVVIAPSPGTPAYLPPAVNELGATVVTGTVAPPSHVPAHAAAGAPASDVTALTAPPPPLTTPITQCAPSTEGGAGTLRTTLTPPTPPAHRSRVRR